MAKEQLIDTVIKNHDTIHSNLVKVQDILGQGLVGDDWDRIVAIGMAGKLLSICRQDVNTTKKCAQGAKEESNGSNS